MEILEKKIEQQKQELLATIKNSYLAISKKAEEEEEEEVNPSLAHATNYLSFNNISIENFLNSGKQDAYYHLNFNINSLCQLLVSNKISYQDIQNPINNNISAFKKFEQNYLKKELDEIGYTEFIF